MTKLGHTGASMVSIALLLEQLQLRGERCLLLLEPPLHLQLLLLKLQLHLQAGGLGLSHLLADCLGLCQRLRQQALVSGGSRDVRQGTLCGPRGTRSPGPCR